jgi:hypothetical protein
MSERHLDSDSGHSNGPITLKRRGMRALRRFGRSVFRCRNTDKTAHGEGTTSIAAKTGESVNVSGPISIKSPYQHEPIRQYTSLGHSQTATNGLRASISVHHADISRSQKIDGTTTVKTTSGVDRRCAPPVRDIIQRTSQGQSTVGLPCNNGLPPRGAPEPLAIKRIASPKRQPQTATHASNAFTTVHQADLKQSLEIDEPRPIKNISDTDRLCEESVRNNAQRISEGRPTVDLLYNDKPPSLGASEPLALKRVASPYRRSQIATNSLHVATMAHPADLAQSWEIDELRPIKNISDADRPCEESIRDNVQRTSEGRPTVDLLFNGKPPSLGASEPQAMKRVASPYCRS